MLRYLGLLGVLRMLSEWRRLSVLSNEDVEGGGGGGRGWWWRCLVAQYALYAQCA